MSRKTTRHKAVSHKFSHYDKQTKFAHTVNLLRKIKGEWAEVEFMSQAIRRGMVVARPWGDSAPFDLIVQGRSRTLYRIQVKAAWAKREERYKVRMGGSRNRSYDPHDFDFYAAYVIPEDVWYIIPIAAGVKLNTVNLYAGRPKSRGNVEKHREAWHRLK